MTTFLLICVFLTLSGVPVLYYMARTLIFVVGWGGFFLVMWWIRPWFDAFYAIPGVHAATPWVFGAIGATAICYLAWQSIPLRIRQREPARLKYR